MTVEGLSVASLEARRPFAARLGPKGTLLYKLITTTDHRPQDDRDHVCGHLYESVFCGRADGAVDARRVGFAGAAVFVQ